MKQKLDPSGWNTHSKMYQLDDAAVMLILGEYTMYMASGEASEATLYWQKEYRKEAEKRGLIT